MTRGGIYSAWRQRVLPLCSRCPLRSDTPGCDDYQADARCPQMARTMDAVYEQVCAAGHITDLSETLVREYAYRIAMLERIDTQIAQEGGLLYTDPDAPWRTKASGLLDLRNRVAGRVDDMAKELGLTPSSQARAGMKAVGDGMSALADALQAVNQRRSQVVGARVEEVQAALPGVVDGEFEAGGDGDDNGSDGA
jgi:hypothetical protein